MKVAFADVLQADTPIRKDKANGVSDRFGNVDPCFAMGDLLGKFAQLGEAKNQVDTAGSAAW